MGNAKQLGGIIFAEARKLASQIKPQPADVEEGEARRLAFRDFHEPFAEAVRAAFKGYVEYAASVLEVYGIPFNQVQTARIKAAVLGEAMSWDVTYKWDFPGLDEADEAHMLQGWAEGAYNGCLKEIGR
uniref:Uncharacterized protein n=1 Tax=viral metagenome TaxID=1070528 RepID=A0A6M3J2M4_9ZZZZ